MSKRVTLLDRALVGKRLMHNHAPYTVRGVWVDSRHNKGEKYLLLYKPNDRHAWDTSDAVVLDSTVAAQYVDNGFAVSLAAGKKSMSGGAAPSRPAAPPELLERERVMPPQARRAPS
jgi:hypothetical protein